MWQNKAHEHQHPADGSQDNLDGGGGGDGAGGADDGTEASFTETSSTPIASALNAILRKSSKYQIKPMVEGRTVCIHADATQEHQEVVVEEHQEEKQAAIEAVVGVVDNDADDNDDDGAAKP